MAGPRKDDEDCRNESQEAEEGVWQARIRLTGPARRLRSVLSDLLKEGLPIEIIADWGGGRMPTGDRAEIDRDPPLFVRRLLVRQTGGAVLCLKVEEIDWVEAANQYVLLHAGKGRHLMRESMAALESRLDPRQFVRIHRSTIVNLERVRKLEVGVPEGRRQVTLTDGTVLPVSQSSWEKLHAALEGGGH